MKLCCAFCFCSSGSSGSRQTIILKDFVCKLPYQRKYGQQSVEELNHIAFLPHNFRVYGYNGTGSMKPLEQQFQNFCYYQGYIEGYPNSMAIVSTCSGLRGLLQFENVSYGIEPLEPSIGFEHVVYQVKHKNKGVSLYAEKDIESREMSHKIQSIEPLSEFSQYIEMHVVVEKNLYNYMGSDMIVVTQKIFQLIGLTNAHPRTISLESLAVILAQLLSLSMGIAYDDINKCQCSGAVCIMNPEAIHSSGVKIFSNCSMEDFAQFISKPKSQCLQNQPHLDPSYKVAVCGNGQVEQGEQCDCGSAEDCETVSNTCCNPATCTLKVGSICDTGACCKNCQYSAKGEICRISTDECDLPEYCNGSSATCQDNFFVQNGHPCGENQWVCLNGSCISGLRQCIAVFGQDADFGPEECYAYLNTKADISGNCGSGASGYIRCKTKDLPCGKLICEYRGEEIINIPNATAIYTKINGRLCVALDFPHDFIDGNKMWVKEGTVCGLNKVCKNQECVDAGYLDYDCTPRKCNERGICNNKKNCHCNPSYLPPNCQNIDDAWIGGSVDSGNFPPQLAQLSSERRYIENVYHGKSTKWPFFLLIPFLIILSVLIIILVKVYFQRKKWRTEEYTSNLKVRVNLKSRQDNRIRHITSSYLQWTGQMEKKKKQKTTCIAGLSRIQNLYFIGLI
ncbi:disintegrin and metalloproteinase domain-containing protein 2 isoform X27 [Canis lupus familiaris]|uniref:disintegrin and metalloproteinase domain-containing protein 2 isoform X27 n=1 Tax=Canis lupus familiaris TaxID=9615 RepID=UPI0015F15024|nr:disintegrin and metalloproteinase domain-containing protein 2 isoform X27 [Canis lupus familiaris]XP_038415939.1 disintegrin and metalloproteinase domain-containing protein 2 isoform X20 [Canis lupus familiaris]